MKATDIKIAASQILLIAGLIFFSIGVRWSFYVGFVLILFSGLFSLRAILPKSRVDWILRLALWIACVSFLDWFSSHGTEKPPIAALVSVWFACSIDEFKAWRQSRRLT